jgi:hypothetical protein
MERAVHLYDRSYHHLYCLAVCRTSLETEVFVVPHERVSVDPMVAQGGLAAAVFSLSVAVTVYASYHLECCCRYCSCLAGIV